MNPFEKFFAALWKGIKYPFTHATAIGELISEAFSDGSVLVADAPQIKSLVENLVAKFEALGPDAIAAFAGEGLNFAADAKTIADLQALFAYFKSDFAPQVEALYNKLKANQLASGADPASPAPAVPAAAAAAAVVSTGPTVVQHG